MESLEETPANQFCFRWPVRVYYEDTDAGGLVYHANYLRFMERARTERLRAHGFELDGLQREHRIMFVVRSMELDFLKPARFNESLWVTADIEQVKSASFIFNQAVIRGEEILCAAKVRVACLSAEILRPISIPDVVLRSLRSAGLDLP
jgi:acyl-CoA thioester hydrolase